jgi:LacI family transcriptional regulator
MTRQTSQADRRLAPGRTGCHPYPGRDQRASNRAHTARATAGVRALAAHLIEDHGYRRLGFLAGPADSPDARERLDAFRHAIARHPGCVLDPVLEGDFSEASGAAAARTLLTLRPAPEVVACANDQMAIGVLLQLQESGAAIRGDMAVSGFDDIYAR